MGRKPKISYELKVINVEKYIKGEKSASELASILGISREQFRRWVNKYKVNGAEGLFECNNRFYDNSIVSYIVGRSNNNKLVFDTFDIAVENNPTASPMFHSDRGYQYTSKNFKIKLDKISATQSISRVGRCIDNGPIEGFCGIIKSEMYYLKKFHNFEELKLAIDKYIEFYNKRRLQKRLKGLTPIEYREQTLAA